MSEDAGKVDVKRGADAPTPAARPDPWAPLSAFKSEIDRLFEGFDTSAWHWPHPARALKIGAGTGDGAETAWPISPAMDLVERNGGYAVEAELPGMDAGDIDVKVAAGMITIKGEKTEEREEEEKNYHLSERRYGAFQRSFRLPEGVDADKIEAKFDKGVLKVTMPKSPDAMRKEKKIEVKSA